MKPYISVVLGVLLIIPLASGVSLTPETIRSSERNKEYSYFVVLHDQADLSAAETIRTKNQKGLYVFKTLKTLADNSQKELIRYLDSKHIPHQSFWIQNMILVTSDLETMQFLAEHPDVDKVEPNQRFRALDPSERKDAFPSPASRGIEWGIRQIGADVAWSYGVTGEGIIVCDNDTGVQWDHPALQSHYLGWDGTNADHNYAWHDCTGTSPLEPLDDNGHGTHTTGTMVGDDGGGNQIGVAPGAKFIAVKNMDSDGGGEAAWFHESFQWILAPTDLTGSNPDPARAPHVVNNSWGFSGNDDQFHADIAALVAAGVFVEASAGNEGPSCQTLRSPGDYNNVLTTGSCQQGALISDFSSRGPSALYPSNPKPDITAPGSNIRSSVPGSKYEGGWSGTSMAGPHTCGMIALLWSANPDLIGQIQETANLIRSTATRSYVTECTETTTAVSPNMVYGYGQIDCYQSVMQSLQPASRSVLFLNKTAYMCSDQVTIRLLDLDLAAEPTLQVSVDSYTEPVPEMITLTNSQSNGVFLGAFTIATGTASSDGVLQIAPGDTIRVMYHDDNYGGGGAMDITAMADVDCDDPVVSDITIDSLTASSAVITFTTDEYASTGMRYSAGTSMDMQEMHEYPCLNHKIELNGMTECTFYNFQVETIDIAGNMTVDDNGGAYYSFETYRHIMIMDAPLDTDPGWTRTGLWEWGQPAGQSGDPTKGYTGVNVFGYNLNGAYENDMSMEVLETGLIDCSAGVNTTISFALWLNIDDYPDDQAAWDVSTDGGATWITLFDNSFFGGPMFMDFWYPIEINLGQLLDHQSNVKFRWTMGPTDSSVVYGGWNIDDIRVHFDAECSYVTPTPTAPPTPTPTIELGVRIDMPAMGHPSEPFYIHGYLDNPGEPMNDVPVFFILEAFEDFWFWPGWKHYSPPDSEEIDYMNMTVNPGSEMIEVIAEFIWPDTGAQTVGGLHFYGAMLTSDMTQIMGSYAFVTFGYGP